MKSLESLWSDLTAIEKIAVCQVSAIQEITMILIEMNRILNRIGLFPEIRSELREDYHGKLTRMVELIAKLGLDPDPVWHEMNGRVELLCDALSIKGDCHAL